MNKNSVLKARRLLIMLTDDEGLLHEIWGSYLDDGRIITLGTNHDFGDNLWASIVSYTPPPGKHFFCGEVGELTSVKVISVIWADYFNAVSLLTEEEKRIRDSQDKD